MKEMNIETRKDFFIVAICGMFSFGLGMIFQDIFIGGTTLWTGLLNGYYAAKGNKINYLFGMLNYLFLGYIAYQNSLYGMFFFYIFLFAPLQMQGYFTWGKKSNQRNQFEIRAFTLQNSIYIIGTCILGSILVGYLLNLLPGQQLAFIDATSNCINLCGMILLNLQFKESWWLWGINNILDFIISIHCVLQHGENAVMMFITASAFILINILGMIQWNHIEKAKTL